MAWNVESANSTFNASEFTKKTMSDRNSVRSASQVKGLSRMKTGLFGYSIVGINANQVPAMREAIRNYVQGIQNHLDGFEASADSTMAFKSEAVKASVQKYMQTLKEYCQNLTSQLLAFSDKLKEVEEKWLEATQNMAQSVDTSTAGFSKGTQYTEQK